MEEDFKPQTNQSFSDLGNLGQVIPHNHDGINSEKVDPKNLLGFPVDTVAPTFPAKEGTIRVGVVGGTPKIFFFALGSWRTIT